MIRLFESAKHAQLYAKFRPTYPKELAETIIKYCKEKKPVLQTALDVGCGSGQGTLQLTPYFKKVIGLDVSEAQIINTPQNIDNVEFRVGGGEDLSFMPESSVDLVTAFQSLHWIDTSVFYDQVRKVLTDCGVLAVCCYGNPVLDNQEASDALWKFYKGPMDSYFDSHRRHIDNMYAEYILPFDDYTRNESMAIVKKMPLTSLIGYLSSWSAYQGYRKANPSLDPLIDLHHGFKAIYNKQSSATDIDDPEVVVTWPIALILGRKCN